MIELKVMQPNLTRAIVGITGVIMVGIGADLLWGAGGGFLTIGLILYLDQASDEAVERVTGIRRGTK
jgi:hypothetical protein